MNRSASGEGHGGWLLGGEFGGQFFGEAGVFLGEVFGFSCRSGVVVEFQVAVAVLDEAVGGGADGASTVGVGNGVARGLGGGVFELGKEGGAVEEIGLFEADEVAESGEDVDGLYD